MEVFVLFGFSRHGFCSVAVVQEVLTERAYARGLLSVTALVPCYKTIKFVCGVGLYADAPRVGISDGIWRLGHCLKLEATTSN